MGPHGTPVVPHPVAVFLFFACVPSWGTPRRAPLCVQTRPQPQPTSEMELLRTPLISIPPTDATEAVAMAAVDWTDDPPPGLPPRPFSVSGASGLFLDDGLLKGEGDGWEGPSHHWQTGTFLMFQMDNCCPPLSHFLCPSES